MTTHAAAAIVATCLAMVILANYAAALANYRAEHPQCSWQEARKDGLQHTGNFLQQLAKLLVALVAIFASVMLSRS